GPHGGSQQRRHASSAARLYPAAPSRADGIASRRPRPAREGDAREEGRGMTPAGEPQRERDTTGLVLRLLEAVADPELEESRLQRALEALARMVGARSSALVMAGPEGTTREAAWPDRNDFVAEARAPTEADIEAPAHPPGKGELFL